MVEGGRRDGQGSRVRDSGHHEVLDCPPRNGPLGDACPGYLPPSRWPKGSAGPKYTASGKPSGAALAAWVSW